MQTPKERKKEDQVEVHIHEPPKSPEDHINLPDTPAEEENLGSSTTTTSNPHPSPSHTTGEQATFGTHSSQEDVDVSTTSSSTTPPVDTPTEEQEQGDSDILDLVGDEDYQGKRKRWNRTGYIFTDAQLDIAEWFSENELLYNRRLKDFKNTSKKDNMSTINSPYGVMKVPPLRELFSYI